MLRIGKVAMTAGRLNIETSKLTYQGNPANDVTPIFARKVQLNKEVLLF